MCLVSSDCFPFALPLLSLCSPFAPPLRLVSLFAALILFCFVRARAAECIVPAPTPPPPPTRVDESSSTAEIDDVWIYVIVALAAALVLGLVFIAYRRQGRVRPQTQTHTAGPLSLLESVAKRCCNCSFRNEFVGLVFLSFGPDCPRSFLIRLPPLLQLVCFAFVLFLYICHPLATYRLKCMWLGPYQRWKPAIQQRGASSNKLGEQRVVFVLFFFLGGEKTRKGACDWPWFFFLWLRGKQGLVSVATCVMDSTGALSQSHETLYFFPVHSSPLFCYFLLCAQG